jgi:hypothetical protein
VQSDRRSGLSNLITVSRRGYLEEKYVVRRIFVCLVSGMSHHSLAHDDDDDDDDDDDVIRIVLFFNQRADIITTECYIST